MTDTRALAPLHAAVPCAHAGLDLWFAESPGDLDRAKSICQQCPVRSPCLESALARREPWGVWGGELFLDGCVIASKRPRGRPRKTAPAA